MTDSEFIETRAREIFEKVIRRYIPEEYQATVQNDLLLEMLKCHIDVGQNFNLEDDEDD